MADIHGALVPILAAVFGGLAAAGIILLVFLRIRGRREGPQPPRVERREPATIS